MKKGLNILTVILIAFLPVCNLLEGTGGEGYQKPTTDLEVNISVLGKKENCRDKKINSQMNPGSSGFE